MERAPVMGDHFSHKITLAINQAHDLVGLIMYDDDGQPSGLPVRVTANVHEDRHNVMTVWLTDEGARRYRATKDRLPIAVIYPED